ncbi:DUF2147 domain-containing protein [Chondrinema litorale]|uniref:DUF2147 domain-containing protein n=1 Tax=Chondrinema litorale TaxID=2994555 RepID=UPI0025426F12|nr:DUF2147 domain-containing protein [Chondrinema litorale]UZR94570.1 DUF2147 domain-containing protein [Chondrinema litorale]
MKIQKLIILLNMLLVSTIALSQSPVGKWKTIDDETGEEKSVVEIYEKNGKIYGKIDQIIDPEEEDPICDECPTDDDRYKKKVIGMEIIRDLEKDGKEWDEGTVLDPEKGKIYDCKIWLEDENTLKLRGYVAFFYRTQTWYRVK